MGHGPNEYCARWLLLMGGWWVLVGGVVCWRWWAAAPPRPTRPPPPQPAPRVRPDRLIGLRHRDRERQRREMCGAAAAQQQPQRQPDAPHAPFPARRSRRAPAKTKKTTPCWLLRCCVAFGGWSRSTDAASSFLFLRRDRAKDAKQRGAFKVGGKDDLWTRDLAMLLIFLPGGFGKRRRCCASLQRGTSDHKVRRSEARRGFFCHRRRRRHRGRRRCARVSPRPFRMFLFALSEKIQFETSNYEQEQQNIPHSSSYHITPSATARWRGWSPPPPQTCRPPSRPPSPARVPRRWWCPQGW